MRRDVIFGTGNRYLIIKGKTVIGEIYLINDKYIFAPKKVRKGLSCRKAG